MSVPLAGVLESSYYWGQLSRSVELRGSDWCSGPSGRMTILFFLGTRNSASLHFSQSGFVARFELHELYLTNRQKNPKNVAQLLDTIWPFRSKLGLRPS